MSSANRYAVFCSIVTFIITAIVVIAHLFPVSSVLFVGTKIEGVVSIVLVVFWAAIVSIVTDASNGLALPEDATNQVQNANLYYFSWAGFITAVIILVSYLRDVFGIDLAGEVRNRAARLQWWAALLACSIIVMGSASQVLRRDCKGFDTYKGDSYCRQTKLAISAGTIGVVFSLFVIGSKVLPRTESATASLVEISTAIFLTILNAFNVAYTTSAGAPGSAIGNLYYFSWAILLVPAMIAAECYGAFLNPPAGSSEDNGDKENGEIEVETFDDAI